jgi:hypothetical protein
MENSAQKRALSALSARCAVHTMTHTLIIENMRTNLVRMAPKYGEQHDRDFLSKENQLQTPLNNYDQGRRSWKDFLCEFSSQRK